MILYPDISSYEGNITLTGVPVVNIKATEGTGYLNPYLDAQLREASRVGAPAWCYHFLHEGNGAAQAQFYFEEARNIPCMLDMEPTVVNGNSSNPSIQDAKDFIDELIRLTGVPKQLYLPHWYWQQLASPDLTWINQYPLWLINSDYRDLNTGVGWQAYGGVTPKVWQYTNNQPLNAHAVDYNAFNGTLLELVNFLFYDILREEDEMVLCSVASEGTEIPGIYLLSGGMYVHVNNPNDLAAFRSLQLKEIAISYAQHLELLAARG